MTITDVLIVGAGPTGLTLANVLAREGVPFRIVDRKAGPVEESRALVVHARSLELLDKLGLAGEAVREGQKLGAAELLEEGKPVGKISFFGDDQGERTPYPFALIYEQHRTERLLIRGLGRAGGRVEWSTELAGLSQTSSGVRATVRHPDGSEEEVEAGWVVGADGASSPVRHALGLGFEGDTYEQTLFLADVEMEWPLRPNQAHVNLTRAGFFGFFPMPGKDRFRIAGSVPPEIGEGERIAPADIQLVIDRYTGLRARITDVRWTSVYRTHRRMTERFRVGRAFLAGDAAHIHSPAGGQGMNTGIGDAYNLAWKLAAVVKGEARESLLDSYEAERMPFARAILGGSDRGFSFLQAAPGSVPYRLKVRFISAVFRLVTTLPPVRRRAFWLVSQLWTSYRGSPAVAESGSVEAGPRAGERAPYGPFESGPEVGKSIFEVLGGTGHHLLLFEGLGPDRNGFRAAWEEIEGLLDRYEVPTSLHRVPAGNRKLHERYGARGPSLFLVRPDGHIAYRGGAADVVGLKVYLDGLFVRRGGRGRATPAPAARERAYEGSGRRQTVGDAAKDCGGRPTQKGEPFPVRS